MIAGVQGFLMYRVVGAAPRANPSFGMTPTFLEFFSKKIFWMFFFCFEKSVSYQKKDGRITRPSFFWYDNDSGH